MINDNHIVINRVNDNDIIILIDDIHIIIISNIHNRNIIHVTWSVVYSNDIIDIIKNNIITNNIITNNDNLNQANNWDAFMSSILCGIFLEVFFSSCQVRSGHPILT